MAISEKRGRWMNLAVDLTDEWVYSIQPTKVIRINADEFIVLTIAVEAHSDKLDSLILYKYKIDANCNLTKRSIIQLINIPPTSDDGRSYDATWSSSNIAFNNEQQTLYIQHNKNIESWSFSYRKSKHNYNYIGHSDKVHHTLLSGGKNGEYFLFINNYFHVINMHDRHWIGSIQNKSLNTLHNTIDFDNNYLKHGKAVNIPSKQCVLLIGGYYSDGPNDGPSSNEIWIYKLKTQKWTKINNISFERYNFEAVLTSNERYIVLFGGMKYHEDTGINELVDDICVLDMIDDNNWKIKQCELKCPRSGKCIGTSTGGIEHDMLVTGFVKGCFKLKEFKNLKSPPTHIISLIAKWYSGEVIHWMKYYDKEFEHLGIYLTDILSSLY
eukprot:305946_1